MLVLMAGKPIRRYTSNDPNSQRGRPGEGWLEKKNGTDYVFTQTKWRIEPSVLPLLYFLLMSSPRMTLRVARHGVTTSKDYPDTLRRIKFSDRERDKTLVFLTNDFIDPLTIAQLYRRWQVELFFKWIKQHLRINIARCVVTRPGNRPSGLSSSGFHKPSWQARCGSAPDLVYWIPNTSNYKLSIYQ